MLPSSKELGNKEQEAEACDVLTKWYCKERNNQESRKYAKELLPISKELENKEQEAEACDVLGKSYCKEGKDQERGKYARELQLLARNWGIKNKKPKRVMF